MAIQMRNKRSTDFSMASMSDLVFLLLIFFMLTSTLVAPNAVKLLLPSSSSKTMAKQTISVYINDQFQYFIEENPIAESEIETRLTNLIQGESEATIVIRSDKSVAVQYIVNVIDVVNSINEKSDKKHKVILATTPRQS